MTDRYLLKNKRSSVTGGLGLIGKADFWVNNAYPPTETV